MATSGVTKVEGVDKVLNLFTERSLKGKKVQTLSCGYSAPYAIYVHEDLTVHHDNGQAKYLEQPARENRQRMIDVVVKTLQQKQSLTLGLERARDILEVASKAVVPVDTGFLYQSWHARID